MTEQEWKQVPEGETSLSSGRIFKPEFFGKTAGQNGSEEELSVGMDCSSLVEYLEKFDLPCSCLRTQGRVGPAGYDILQTMSMENVCYGEIRFAPLLSVTEEMDTKRVNRRIASWTGKRKTAVWCGI